MRIEWDLKKEIVRKSIHIFSVAFLVIYVLVTDSVNSKVGLLVLSFLLILLIELEYARVELGAKIPILKHLWKFRRDKEKEHFGGEIYFLVGSIICLSIFDLRIAAAAMLMSTFGDMASAIVGKRFGRTWVMKERALEGILAEFAVDLLIGFAVIRTHYLGKMWWASSWYPQGDPLWLPIIVMAVTATVVETVVHKLDDNLLVPVFAGFNGEIILLLFVNQSFV
jgi:phytol kinase